MWIHHSIRKKKVSVSFCFQYHFLSNLSQDKNICNQWKNARPENEFYHLPKHFQGKYIVLGPYKTPTVFPFDLRILQF